MQWDLGASTVLGNGHRYKRGPSHFVPNVQATRHISFAPPPPEENAGADMGKPIPAAYGGRPAPSPRRPHQDVMDYTVKAGVRPSHVRGPSPAMKQLCSVLYHRSTALLNSLTLLLSNGNFPPFCEMLLCF